MICQPAALACKSVSQWVNITKSNRKKANLVSLSLPPPETRVEFIPVWPHTWLHSALAFCCPCFFDLFSVMMSKEAASSVTLSTYPALGPIPVLVFAGPKSQLLQVVQSICISGVNTNTLPSLQAFTPVLAELHTYLR